MSARLATGTLHPSSRRSFLVSLWALVLTVSSAGTRTARAEEAPPFRVIVHPENPARTADRAMLAKFFLKESTKWEDGETAHPVDLRGDSETRSKFSEAVIKRSIGAVRNYWQQRIFSGRGVPPPEVESDAEVVRYVMKHRGAVGYVSGRADLGKTRALTVNY